MMGDEFLVPDGEVGSILEPPVEHCYPTVIFPPGLTGPLHLANALILHLSAREAKRQGWRFAIRLDDIRPVSGTKVAPDIKREGEAIASIMKACELLDIVPDIVFKASELFPLRYTVMKALEKRFHEQDWEKMVSQLQMPLPFVDECLGREISLELLAWRQRAFLFLRYARIVSAFDHIVDYMTWQTPLHIRGMDLLGLSMMESLLFPIVASWIGRPLNYYGPRYAHIPLVVGRKGSEEVLLSKTLGVDNVWDFEAWATDYKTAEERKRALEEMVLSVPWHPGNRLNEIESAARVAVDWKGRKIRTHTMKHRLADAVEGRRRGMQATGTPIPHVSSGDIRLPGFCKQSEEFWRYVLRNI